MWMLRIVHNFAIYIKWVCIEFWDCRHSYRVPCHSIASMMNIRIPASNCGNKMWRSICASWTASPLSIMRSFFFPLQNATLFSMQFRQHSKLRIRKNGTKNLEMRKWYFVPLCRSIFFYTHYCEALVYEQQIISPKKKIRTWIENPEILIYKCSKLYEEKTLYSKADKLNEHFNNKIH